MQPHEIARQIAYIPQAHNKTFPYTVLDVVLMGGPLIPGSSLRLLMKTLKLLKRLLAWWA
jgi:ABC-type cobalamin/Fe3+-siderophores transport system ATPase subunit